jgi:hypothetical protein
MLDVDGDDRLRDPSWMAEPTSFFVVLLGGALVGLVTARVRDHDMLRSVLDVAAGAVGGFFGTPIWIAFVQHVLPRIAEPLPEASPRFASILSAFYYVSPILGAFLGVAIMALAYRLLKGTPRQEPWMAKLGDYVRIVGIVYLIVAVCLTVAVVALAAAQSRWDVALSPALLIDLAYGTAIVLAGWAMRRFSAGQA